MPRKLLFENVTCGRCGGSGNYSYCQSYGTTCFNCHGDGVVLTKRGRAAQHWLNARKNKKGRDIVVGDCFLSEGIPGFSASLWVKVDAVTGSGAEHEITGLDKRGERHRLKGFEDMDVRVSQTKARLAELRTEALAFQAALTKAGTVAKRKRKEAA